MEYSKNNSIKEEQTPEENTFGFKISKNDFSSSSLGENIFPNISTKTRTENKNYLTKIKDQEKDSLCRKIDFSMEIDSNDSKEILSEEKEHSKNDNSNFSIKDESNNNIININNKISLSSEEEMEAEEELDLRLIKKQSSKSICLTNSKFDEDYIIIKTLSEGENGNVYLCMKIQDNKTYVVKMSTSFTRKIDYFNLERIIMDISKHSENKYYPFIHKYNDCWIEEGIHNNEKNSKNTVNKKIIYMVSNYCPNGNLVEFIQKIKECDKENKTIYTILNSEFYWDIIFQMMISLEFFHKVGYIHLDIKPTNFLVDLDGILQLTDFSLCIKENEIDKLLSIYEYEGDSKYISPEMFYKQFNKLSHKTDIFSLGLSIYELLSGNNLPLNGEIWQKIRKEGLPTELYKKIINFDNYNSIQFMKLIKIMTNIEVSDRPEIENILKDDYNFPSLNNRYKSLEKNSFGLSYDLNKIPNFKCPKYDFSSNNISLKDLFIKRSDSMKNEFFVK